jgi:hypothetical protein
VGILTNVYLWKAQPQIFWFWWNVIGLLVTCTFGLLGSRFWAVTQPATTSPTVLEKPDFNLPETRILILYFVAILLISIALPYMFG